MAHFNEDHIDLRLPQRGKIRTTLSELQYHSDIVDSDIIVPIGFKTDLGSIPTWLQWLFPKDGKAVLGYVLHDYMYKIGFDNNRAICDDILKESMKVLGVKSWRIHGVRIGLKIGGSFAWNRHRENDNA